MTTPNEFNDKLDGEFDLNPFVQFTKWYNRAVQAQIKNPDAMTLATADLNGTPSARIVLYKGINEKGFKFFTNYKSRKGEELLTNPQAALVFYWSALDLQIRIEGKVETLSGAESDEYWLSRPRGSRLSALASPQSQPIVSREVLEKQIDKLADDYEGKEIPRPDRWGGFCLIPKRFEFWKHGDDRLHDRYCYVTQLGAASWKLIQLAP